MIDLVGRICRCEGTEAEIDAAVQLFQANCKHPDGTDLIFWPHGCPDDPAKPEPTVEEIVDKAMGHIPPWQVMAELWDWLRRVQFLQFVAQSASPSGWNGKGSGRVTVRAPDSSTLIFTEKGTWRPNGGQELGFHNVFRWVVLDVERVRLEHLRFGPDQPVFLFDLVPESPKTWVSDRPHLCQEDRYTAELQLDKGQVHLHWNVTGPKKQESIRYEYRT